MTDAIVKNFDKIIRITNAVNEKIIEIKNN